MKPQVVVTMGFVISALVAPVAASAADRAEGAAPPASVGQATAVPADPATKAPAASSEFRYGPIHAEDPAVRAQIKQLYREQADLDRATGERLAELSAAFQVEADGDVRLRLQREMIQAKQDLQLHSMELGLEIARLNEDVGRVAEYEQAIDRMLHPEKYLPAPADPSIARERARALGLEN